jgi:hypothetical protein
MKIEVIEVNKKEDTKMKKAMAVVLVMMAFCAPVFSAQNGQVIGIKTDAGNFLLPFQIVNGTQLYSFREGKGFPGAETTLWMKGRCEFTFGAAPVIGTDINVPFAGVQTRLSPAVFDTTNNDLLFGVWVGKPSRRISNERPTWLWGVKASVPLW